MTSNSLIDAVSPSAGPPADQVQDELNRILDSPDFKSTPRRRKLLKYLVEELLAGRDKGFKGYTIATMVFGRDESFDPQADPVVRLEARRLRHDLNSYYVSAGRNNSLRITVPKGQYTPVIEWTQNPVTPGDEVDLAAAILQPIADAEPIEPARKIASRRRLIVGASAGLTAVVIAGLALWHLYGGRNAHAPGKGPALAVLPFTTDGAAPGLAVMGHGIADEVLNGLNRFQDIRLYLPGSETVTTGGPVAVGERLGLSYVLDGSVQSTPQADALRITARLTEVTTRRIVWIGRYERSYTASSVLSVQDEIANSVASAVGQPYGIIRTEESQALTTPVSASATSYECVLRAYTYRRSLSAEAFGPALACLEQAVKRDPGYAEAWAMLGWLQMDAGRFGWASDGNARAAYDRGLSTALHAQAIDPDNISSLKALGSIYHYLGDFQESERVQRRALALNPNDPDTMAQLGWRLAVRGRFDEGLPFLRQAIERTVNPPGWYYHLIAVDHYLRGQYEEMLQTAKTATADGSGMSWSFVAIAEGALNDEAEAKRALLTMAEISPRLARDPAEVYRRAQATDKITDALVAGLRKAGWQKPTETPSVP